MGRNVPSMWGKIKRVLADPRFISHLISGIPPLLLFYFVLQRVQVYAWSLTRDEAESDALIDPCDGMTFTVMPYPSFNLELIDVRTTGTDFEIDDHMFHSYGPQLSCQCASSVQMPLCR